jgi:hypothetical protein
VTSLLDPRRDTPAKRAKDRKRSDPRKPALSRPPRPRVRDRRQQLNGLKLNVDGRDYRIGGVIVGDPASEAAIDAAATWSIAAHDPAGQLEDLLADEAVLLDGAARVTIDGAEYVLSRAEADGAGLLTLTAEDEVAWRMRQHTRFFSMVRTSKGLFEFAYRLVKEASAPPYSRMRFYCPELGDKQAIQNAKEAGDIDVSVEGGGAGGDYKVKGQPASPVQQRTINAVLEECAAQRTSRQVAIAAIMCVTQESGAGEASGVTTGNDDVGPFQQGRNWISLANVQDPAKACRAFLLGPEADVGGNDPSVQGWKQRHGSLKTSTGDLDAMITAVQISVGGYGQWRDEAERTVEEWASGSSGTVTQTLTKPYRYTRGEKGGQPESSWDAIARYAEPVGVRRWAQDNVLFVVSDEELRHAAPAIEIDGTEAFLLSEPAWEWSPGRPVNEVTLRVAAGLWGMRVGSIVRLDRRYGIASGVYVVAAEAGYMVNPELEVTLRRPAPKRPEPAPQTREISGEFGQDPEGGDLDLGGGASGAMWEACSFISKQGRPYLYGGGHGKAFKDYTDSEGLDCSSSTTYALWLAGLYDSTMPVVSGQLAGMYNSGPGKEFTIYANVGHVWVRFANGVEFNTGGHPGVSGPRVGRFGYPTAGFVARHVAGH